MDGWIGKRVTYAHLHLKNSDIYYFGKDVSKVVMMMMMIMSTLLSAHGYDIIMIEDVLHKNVMYLDEYRLAKEKSER